MKPRINTGLYRLFRQRPVPNRRYPIRPASSASRAPAVLICLHRAAALAIDAERTDYRTAGLPNSRGMGKTFPDVRDAGQKDRLMLMTFVSAEDVLVPVIRIGTVLHQMAVQVVRPGRLPSWPPGPRSRHHDRAGDQRSSNAMRPARMPCRPCLNRQLVGLRVGGGGRWETNLNQTRFSQYRLRGLLHGVSKRAP